MKHRRQVPSDLVVAHVDVFEGREDAPIAFWVELGDFVGLEVEVYLVG
jgi:hypothetical protein